MNQAINQYSILTQYLSNLTPTQTSILGILLLIAVALKGYCLWNAAQKNHKIWFIFLLIVNTVGILEIIYIVFVIEREKFNKEKLDNTSDSAPTV